jgi:hypothetical protein
VKKQILFDFFRRILIFPQIIAGVYIQKTKGKTILATAGLNHRQWHKPTNTTERKQTFAFLK